MTKNESKLRSVHREFKRITSALSDKLEDRDLASADELLCKAKELSARRIVGSSYWLREIIPSEVAYYEAMLEQLRFNG